MIKTYKGRKPRSEEERQLMLRTMRGVALNWCLTTAGMLVLCLAVDAALYPVLIYFSVAMLFMAVAGWMIASRYSERFADPTLSMPQLIIASANHALAMWMVPQIGLYFLINMLQVFAFGLFQLRARQYRNLLLLTGAMILFVILHRGSQLAFPINTRLGQVMLFLVFFHAMWQFVMVVNHVGELRRKLRAENAALAQSEARFKGLTELSSDWYWERDAEGRYTRFESGRGRRVTNNGSMVGKRVGETGFEIEFDGGWEAFKALLDARKTYYDVVFKKRMEDGTVYYSSVSGMPLFGPKGEFLGYHGVSRDITEQRRAAERIEYLATHDGLTGLPNRFLFNQLLSLTLQRARRQNQRFAVLFVDLDRFKAVNDTLGHHAGDVLLKTVAARMKDALRAADVVARIGGDEFAVLVQEVEAHEQLAIVAGKLLAAASQPVEVDGELCDVSASIGIAIYPEHGADEESLMRNGDVAMYMAKESGRNAYQFFQHEDLKPAMRRRDIEGYLRGALQRGEFALHYQPRQELASARIAGVEALLRWNSPELGNVPPAQFISVAEETGSILAIGRWVLHQACAQSVAWQRAGLGEVPVSVNLSARQFADEDLPGHVQWALQESGLAPQLLELELPEAVVFHHPAHSLKAMRALKEIGVRLAIAGFGGSYASLRELGTFPVDTLKVDRAIIGEVGHDERSERLAGAVLAMGRALGVRVVAEGVETSQQESFLRAQVWEQVQGYRYCEPLAGEDLAQWLRGEARTGLPLMSA